ncbi:MurR/RpiR family transcriptional regulator [Enterococcus sp. BWR-S5]|uniref:MurR/RpiR family transcriptional regulator n=1 Tax=Enterococcus sp. BWR-S5 TaxID=2787714 RepID=UPI001924191B|nr:MurR/RpiR family transcriptional regulator [Enterococcus sp. BWR-S5]MBL1224872.1 MurR/RpiR family transcriptional regulator [Enterococcus sp. BWR-S5]
MFDLEKVQTLNDLELIVYQYILEHITQIPKLTIRELSAKCHVSTSTILRFCTKMGFEGFSELKFAVKNTQERPNGFEDYYAAAVHVDSFLKKINQGNYQETFKPAIDLVLAARHVVFIGLGTSGVLGAYGSRYFSNIGINSYNVSDPFTPIPPRGFESTLVIVLSVSGETSEILKMVSDFKCSNAKILSITNDENSTIAKLADYNISYYMPEEKSAYADPFINLTTQIPVIALIELLAHQAGKQLMLERAAKEEE